MTLEEEKKTVFFVVKKMKKWKQMYSVPNLHTLHIYFIYFHEIVRNVLKIHLFSTEMKWASGRETNNEW